MTDTLESLAARLACIEEAATHQQGTGAPDPTLLLNGRTETDVRAETRWTLDETARFRWSWVGIARTYGTHSITCLIGLIVGTLSTMMFDTLTTSREEILAKSDKNILLNEIVARLAAIDHWADSLEQALRENDEVELRAQAKAMRIHWLYYEYGVGVSPFAENPDLRGYSDTSLVVRYEVMDGRPSTADLLRNTFGEEINLEHQSGISTKLNEFYSACIAVDLGPRLDKNRNENFSSKARTHLRGISKFANETLLALVNDKPATENP